MRAAIYLRISLDRYGDGLAVERQREDCEQIIRDRGWTLVDTYTDQSISASDKNTHRPAYARMEEDARRGRFDAVVCYDLDRLTRQPRQLEDWIDAAQDGSIRLVTANGEADLGTDAGRLFARVKAAVARQEVERKSDRQKRAALQRAEQGKPWTARRPFGFEDDAKTHRPDEAVVVRWIYEQYLTGVGQHEIVRRLKGMGVKTTLGKEWRQATLRQFLLNPRNAGLRSYKGEIVGPAVWEPIVSEAQYRAVVAHMEGRSDRSYNRTRKHLMIGLAECGVCGATVRTGYSPTSKKKARLYECPNSHTSRNAEKVDQYVTETVLAVVAANPAILTPETDDNTRQLTAEAEALRARLDALATEFADGSLTSSQLRAATGRARANLQAVESRLAASQSDSALSPFVGVEDVRAVWDGLGVEHRREFIRALFRIRLLPTSRGRTFRPEHVEITRRTEGDEG